jgi:hypothetical protein
MKYQKQLDIKQIITILSDEEIRFKCGIDDLGEDTMYEILHFTLTGNYKDFTFCLDVCTHKSNISLNNWFYQVYTKEEFLKLIKKY